MVLAFYFMASDGGKPLHFLLKNPGKRVAWLHLSQADAARIMKEQSDYIVVDARSPQEYAAGHIPGAINIPYDNIGYEKLKEIPEMEQPVFVYCQNGMRSRQAAEKLMVIGYKRVCEFGGFSGWKGDIET